MGGEAVVILRRVFLPRARAHWTRLLLALLGIAIGIALAYVALSVERALDRNLRADAESIAGRAELEITSSDGTGLSAPRVLAAGSATRGVAATAPVSRTITTLWRGGRSVRVVALGLTNDLTQLFPPEASPSRAVTELGIALSNRGIFVSGAVESALGARLGDVLRVETPSGATVVPLQAVGRPTGDGGVLVETRGSRLRIGPPPGNTRSLLAINGGDIAALSLPVAQALFGRGDRVDSVYVVTRPAASVSRVADELRARLGGSALVGMPGAGARAAITSVREIAALVSLAALVALVLACVIAFNAVALAVADRRSDLAASFALGATVRATVIALALETALVAAVAGVVGISGGYFAVRALANAIAERDPLLGVSAVGDTPLDPAAVALAVVAGIVVAVLGALWGARAVAQIAPIEALRPASRVEGARAAQPSRGPWRRAGVAAAIAGVAAAATAVGGSRNAPMATWLSLLVVLVAGTAATALAAPVALRALRARLPARAGLHSRAALGWLSSGQSRATITAAVIAIAGAAFVGVGGALSSVTTQLKHDGKTWNGADLFVRSQSYKGVVSDQPLPLSFGRELARVPGVRFVFPWRYTVLNVRGEQALLYSVPVLQAAREGGTTALSGNRSARELRLLGRGGVAVSALTARRHGYHIGDGVVLPTPTGARRFRVAATFADLATFDTFFLDDSTFRRLWHDRFADRFGLLLDRGADPHAVTAAVDRAIRHRHLLAEVVTRDEVVDELLGTLQGVLSIAKLVQVGALLAALLILATTVLTALGQRSWEFGLERVLGATGRGLARQVAFECTALGVVGGLAAAAVGTVAGWLITRATSAQFAWSTSYRTPWSLLVEVVVGSAVVAALVSVLASRRATRHAPWAALRFE
jgi:putative ABC transport system permease protein